jgi:hypothetical protein
MNDDVVFWERQARLNQIAYGEALERERQLLVANVELRNQLRHANTHEPSLIMELVKAIGALSLRVESLRTTSIFTHEETIEFLRVRIAHLEELRASVHLSRLEALRGEITGTGNGVSPDSPTDQTRAK